MFTILKRTDALVLPAVMYSAKKIQAGSVIKSCSDVDEGSFS